MTIHDAHHKMLSEKHIQVVSTHRDLFESPSNTHIAKQQHQRFIRQNYSAQGNFGGVATFQISNADLTRQCVLYVKGADLAANQTLLPNAFMNLINKVLIRIGNSDQITLPSSEIMQLLSYSQCNSQNKRELLADLAGVPSTSGSVEILGVLKLPFSSVKQSIPFFSYLIGAPITIDVYFNPAAGFIIGGSAQSSYSNTMLACQLYVETMVPINNMENLQQLPPNSESFLDWFYNRPVQVGSVSLSSVAGTLNNVTLTNISSARLAGILVVALSNTKAAAGNLNSYARLKDIQLSVGGQTLISCPQNSFELFDINSTNSRGSEIPVYEVGSSQGTYTRAYKYLFKFGSGGIDHSDNVEIPVSNNYGNQQMNLQFNTLTTDTFTLKVCYIYSACARVKGDRSVDLFYLQ